jgi:hypothetical protein
LGQDAEGLLCQRQYKEVPVAKQTQEMMKNLSPTTPQYQDKRYEKEYNFL